MLTESAPNCSNTAYEAGFTGPISAETLKVVSAGSTPAVRSLCSDQSTPSSATSRHFTPSSVARTASSSDPATASWPRARSPAPPDSVRVAAPMSQVPRGPVNRHSSTERSAQAATISPISESVSIQTPLPWLMRWTGTPSLADSSSTTPSASGPSTDGTSVRQEPPSGKRRGEASAGSAAGAARPSAVSARSPGRRGTGADTSVTGGFLAYWGPGPMGVGTGRVRSIYRTSFGLLGVGRPGRVRCRGPARLMGAAAPSRSPGRRLRRVRRLRRTVPAGIHG